MTETVHEIFDFMQVATGQIASDYTRIQRLAREDPGTAGDEGEGNWQALLQAWLPSMYKVVTKGRILHSDGTTSPQLDVLVLHPAYPPSLIKHKLFLDAGVAAVFECKVTLRSEHITKAFQTASTIRRKLELRTGSPYRELYSPVVYGLLAHSHEWKNAKSDPMDRIEKLLFKAHNKETLHPREMLDTICVADLASWHAIRMPWLGPTTYPRWETSDFLRFPGDTGYVHTQYAAHRESARRPEFSISEPYTAIGSLISYLFHRLAWEDPNLRPLASYFQDVSLQGVAVSLHRTWHAWTPDVYSDEVKQKLLPGPAQPYKVWSEWNWLDY